MIRWPIHTSARNEKIDVTRILSVSSSRADVGILAPVWASLAKSGGVDLHILLTGMHMRDDAPAPSDMPHDATLHRGGADLVGAGAAACAAAMSAIGAAAARVCDSVAPDLVLIVGDRLDMAPAALAVVPFNLPLAHIHGGELTFGALDDRLRHAISKLAHLHFAATADAAHRLSQMGEEPWRIQVTGAPGLDTLSAVAKMDRSDFLREIGLPDHPGLRLVTVHPETNADNPAAALEALLPALGENPAPALVTAPNSDPGGGAMRARIVAFVEDKPWAIFRDTLGSRLYANALRHADVMLGNSSSGLIEAPLFGLPVINIGGRQEGRVKCGNVVDCAAKPDAVAAALRRLEKQGFPRSPLQCSPWGDGRAGPRIAAALSDLPPRDRLLRKVFSSRPTKFVAPWKAAA